MKGYKECPPIEVDEEDVLYDLKHLYRPGKTRMSCQINLTKEMEGCEIEIPRSAFALFDKFGDDDD